LLCGPSRARRSRAANFYPGNGMNGRFLCEEIVKSGGLPLNPPVKKKRFEARTDKGNLTVWLWQRIMTVGNDVGAL